MKHSFKLKYAPHIGSFKHSAGEDPIDQIKYMADQGFTALEDSSFCGTPLPKLMGLGMMCAEADLVEKVRKTMESLGMAMGTFVFGPMHWPISASLTSGNKEWREEFLAKCHKAVEVAKRLNGRYITMTADYADVAVPLEVQWLNVIESFKRAAGIFEPHGITMLIEPLSFPPSIFIKTSKSAYYLCKQVNSPSCKFVFDVFHMQQTEGNLIHHIDLTWDEIAYFQLGDVPGRKEPGTGEINYKNVLRHVYRRLKTENKAGDMIFGMEHYSLDDSMEGEQALIRAYLELDEALKD